MTKNDPEQYKISIFTRQDQFLKISLKYHLMNEFQDFILFGLNSLKQALSDLTHLIIIINKKNPEIQIIYSLFAKIWLKLGLVLYYLQIVKHIEDIIQ
jgi:hypothetical protein